MIKALDEPERTMAFAEVALGQIRSSGKLLSPAIMKSGTSMRPDTIHRSTRSSTGAGAQRQVSDADLELIYETYLSQTKTADRIDKVGARVIGEIDDVMTLITEALGMSASYDDSLADATRKLSVAGNRDEVKAVVEALVKSTREMRGTNKALEERLTLSKSEISNLQHSLEAIRAESLTDPLTGLGNRKYFDRSIDVAVQQALANGQPLSLLMFDIDHFKSFNDSYGHLTGDQVLRLVGMSLKQTIKGQDITARYGGEEFAVVLPNAALRQALTVADHIRRAVMAKELKKKSTGEILGRVTISVGVSMLKPGDDIDSLIERADACSTPPSATAATASSAKPIRNTPPRRIVRSRDGLGAPCFSSELVLAGCFAALRCFRSAARCAAASAALAQSVSCSGSSYSRSGNCQYDPTVTVLALV